jgi:hypothetical protein
MRILITGTGRNGSWAVRGEQLGAAIGAAVVPMASAEQCRRADLVVIVKRARGEILDAVRRSGRPWVWDVVDAWPQPTNGTVMDERHAKRWLREQLDILRPDAVVWPTGCMQADGRYGGPQVVLAHHSWPKYTPQPLRAAVEVVGYEGNAHYLGAWRGLLEQECALRGWRFEVNAGLERADIGVALRSNGGYPALHWKSNCKLANLQALGIPALCSPERGYQETASGSEVWIETPGQLASALDQFEDLAERQRVRDCMRPVLLADIARRYREFLCACVS